MNAQTQTTANTQAKLLDTNDQLIENAVKLGENTAGIVSNIGEAFRYVSEMVRETANFSTAVGEFLTRGLLLSVLVTEAGDTARTGSRRCQ